MLRTKCKYEVQSLFALQIAPNNKKKTKLRQRDDSDGDDDSLELFLLDVAAPVVVQDGKDLLDVLGALVGEATHLEELLGAEAVWC